jgi:hypothetical protein
MPVGDCHGPLLLFHPITVDAVVTCLSISFSGYHLAVVHSYCSKWPPRNFQAFMLAVLYISILQLHSMVE